MLSVLLVAGDLSFPCLATSAASQPSISLSAIETLIKFELTQNGGGAASSSHHSYNKDQTEGWVFFFFFLVVL